jgi:26S proteasome regulatory subunit T5
MSTLEDLDDLEREQKEEKKDDKKEGSEDGKDGRKADGDAEMKDAEPEEDVLDDEILNLGTRDIVARKRLLENDMRIMRSEFQRLTHEKASMNEKIRDNLEKIENNRYGLTFVPHLPPCTIWELRLWMDSNYT